MSKVIGVVCEGPTDYEAIKRIVDMVTQDNNEFLRLQPEESLEGQFGNGWKGVWKWCESYGPIFNNYMHKATPKIDCLIVQMDGDVSRSEKEVHCTCEVTVCEYSGVVHPLNCRICKEGKCPVMLPCSDHETGGHAAHLSGLVRKWLCLSEESSTVINAVPCDSIDTWVAVSYGDLTDMCEQHPDPWSSIIARGAYYHSIRIQGGRKRVPVYQIFSDNICREWVTVKTYCLQAQAFESAICEKLLP
jgi:hypothetical protein